MADMTKRILALMVAAVVALGFAGVAVAATSPDRPSFGLENADLAAADPAPPPPPPGGKRAQMQACAKPKVDAGADRKTAVKECATQLGIKPGAKGGLRGLGKAAHAEVVVPKKDAPGQWETVVLDRGKVTATAAGSISVQRPDGPTVTVKVVATTKVKGAAAVTDLAPGREVVIVSAAGEARTIVARP